jgi:DNA (cytosine-5)-methyltransferase 1
MTVPQHARPHDGPPVISLFTGGGGLDLGLEAAGFSTRVCVELAPAACETLRRNRPDWPLLQGDLREISTSEILRAAGLEAGEAALVIGGPPCQGFSSAGKRDPNDPRNRLFWEFVRVVEEAQPWGFLMENVRGLLTMKTDDGGSVLAVILAAFRAIGYSVEVKLIDAASYGVPQRRLRAFFVGLRSGGPVGFPEATHGPGLRPWVTVREAIGDLPAPF